MKTGLIILGFITSFLYGKFAFATCSSSTLSCEGDLLSVKYELSSVQCFAPGKNTPKTMTLSQKQLGDVEFRETDDLTFTLTDNNNGSITVEIVDNRADTNEGENLSTNGPQTLSGYSCNTKLDQ